MSREIQLNSSITSLEEAVKKAKVLMTYENKQIDSICSIIKESKTQEGQPLQKPWELQLPESQIAKLEESISELSIQLANLRSEGAVTSTNCRTKVVQGCRTFVKCFTCGSSYHFVRTAYISRPKEELHGGWETNFLPSL